MDKRLSRLRIIYSGILLVSYFGFFLACAFSPATMAHTIIANNPATIAMALGGALIAGSVVLTGLYTLAVDKVRGEN